LPFVSEVVVENELGVGRERKMGIFRCNGSHWQKSKFWSMMGDF